MKRTSLINVGEEIVLNSFPFVDKVGKEKIPDYESFEFTIKEGHEDLLERKLISRNLVDGHIAVDLGGGYGRLTNVLLEHFKYVVLVEYSERNMERAVRSLDGNRVLFVLADARNPPIMDGSVDFMLSLRVMHHYPTLEFLDLLANKLRKGGTFLFNVNNVSSPVFALSMLKNFASSKKIEINMFSRCTQEVRDGAGRSSIYFLNYRDILGSVPGGCRIDKMIGAGILHNRLVEKRAGVLDLERLTDAELFLSKALNFARLYPDIFVFLKSEREKCFRERTNIIEVLSCNFCGSAMKREGENVVCLKCGKCYVTRKGIIYMRDDSRELT